MEITIQYTCETADQEEQAGARTTYGDSNANLITATIVALRTLHDILTRRYGESVRVTDLEIEITSTP